MIPMHAHTPEQIPTQTPTAVHSSAASYAKSFSPAERDRLIEAHLPQVRFIADRLAAKLPPSVDRDDLIGAGVLGLLDAVEKFDARRGVMFKTYAEMRVRGAMLDSLRDLDWAPRSARRRAREVENVMRTLEGSLGRAATEEEIANRLGITLQEFHQLLNELRGLNVANINDDDDDEGGVNLRHIADDPTRTPLAIYQQTEARETLTAAVESLPERERQIVALYFVEELTMKEIGAVLGVTESRVSQIRTSAILRLRSALGECETNS